MKGSNFISVSEPVLRLLGYCITNSDCSEVLPKTKLQPASLSGIKDVSCPLKSKCTSVFPGLPCSWAGMSSWVWTSTGGEVMCAPPGLVLSFAHEIPGKIGSHALLMVWSQERGQDAPGMLKALPMAGEHCMSSTKR